MAAPRADRGGRSAGAAPNERGGRRHAGALGALGVVGAAAGVAAARCGGGCGACFACAVPALGLVLAALLTGRREPPDPRPPAHPPAQVV